MNARLDEEPKEEDIKEALFQMHPDKAPGLDGMHALFFQKFWNIVGSEIVQFVLNWWKDGRDLSEVNKTCVVLIPNAKTQST